eukprot:COSAG06_NODE_3592_length_5143_cov_3.329104_5_plen_41_part_00
MYISRVRGGPAARLLPVRCGFADSVSPVKPALDPLLTADS